MLSFYVLLIYALPSWSFLRQNSNVKLYCSKPENKSSDVSGKEAKWAKKELGPFNVNSSAIFLVLSDVWILHFQIILRRLCSFAQRRC